MTKHYEPPTQADVFDILRQTILRVLKDEAYGEIAKLGRTLDLLRALQNEGGDRDSILSMVERVNQEQQAWQVAFVQLSQLIHRAKFDGTYTQKVGQSPVVKLDLLNEASNAYREEISWQTDIHQSSSSW